MTITRHTIMALTMLAMTTMHTTIKGEGGICRGRTLSHHWLLIEEIKRSPTWRLQLNVHNNSTNIAPVSNYVLHNMFFIITTALDLSCIHEALHPIVEGSLACLKFVSEF
jgi:hypothetical protein